MSNRPFPYHKLYRALIIIFVLAATLFLGVATYYINYWPTDSESPYLPTAAKLFTLPFLSQMHTLPEHGMLKLTMHAKEALILGIALMQRILNDYTSLYPNVLLLILCVMVSAVLFYIIFKNLFNLHAAMLAFILFAASFWPYMYVLQGAHPPLVLMNFLLAVFFIQCAARHSGFYFLSGICAGFMLFSSPTSPLYLPYYCSFFVYDLYKRKKGAWTDTSSGGPTRAAFRRSVILSAWILPGAMAVFLLFTVPHPIESIRYYLKFLDMSRHSNNFFIYKDYLTQFFPLPHSLRGAGWVWIPKYFFLIMPVVFAAYLLSLGYLAWASLKKPVIAAIILASLSTPLAVEISGMAQFGRNYFSWFFGIIFIIVYACYHVYDHARWLKRPKYKVLFGVLLAFFLTIHVIFNAYAFFNDVFPSRMATTNIYRWFIDRHINEAFTYQTHPRYLNIIRFFNNTKYGIYSRCTILQ